MLANLLVTTEIVVVHAEGRGLEELNLVRAENGYVRIVSPQKLNLCKLHGIRQK